MRAAFLLTLALALGIAAAPRPAVAAGKAGQPPVTGSMYNGNNVQPPLAFVQEPTEPTAQADTTGPVTNRGGESDTARAGGGG